MPRKPTKGPAKKTPMYAIGMGLCVLLLMLWATTNQHRLQGEVATTMPYLSACSQEDVTNLFWYDEDKDPYGVLNELSERYHQEVSDIIDEYLAQLTEESQASVECTAEEYETLLQPGERLQALAEELPLFSETQEIEYIGQGSISIILNEYLRLYECTLAEYNLFIIAPSLSKAERQYDNVLLSGFSRKLENEIRTARAALNHVLTALSGLNRLQPIDAELTCLQRASIDIRNSFALTAEASACLPRIWDTRDVLKDL